MRSAKFILGTQYFVYFGVMGLFLPYFTLYCFHLGFTGFQIGLLASVRTLATALFPMVWGAVADRFLIRRRIYIFCNFISTAIWGLYLLTTDFWMMFAVTVFYGIFYAPIISFLESFSMDLLGKEKTRYGRSRAWGSFGFVLIVIAAGRAIDAFSVEIILILVLAGSLLQAYLSPKLPDSGITGPSALSTGARKLLRPRVILFLFCAFLMLASHGTYYGFFSIHLENLGYSNTFIGVSWALASIAEILVMIFADRLFKRFSYENILILSFLVAGSRWVILAGATSVLPILFAQLFHAFSYGAFHVASILYIDAQTPRESKTLGQAVNNAVTYGFGIMAGFLFNGFFFDTIGAFRLFGISAVLAFCGGALLLAGKTGKEERAAD
jgi:MFS transporter, PPP family, 3-phenylpropionic acid transporter